MERIASRLMVLEVTTPNMYRSRNNTQKLKIRRNKKIKIRVKATTWQIYM